MIDEIISWYNAQRWLEPAVFCMLLFFMLIPVFRFDAFISMDGPAHLYNSMIIKDLLLGDSQLYGEFFSFNTRIEPNWIGHALMIILLFPFEPMLAEKLVVAIYVIGFMVGFRYLVRAFKTCNGYNSYFGFAFVYTVPLHMGFYNFNLGLVSMFFLIGFWVKNSRSLNLKKAIQLFMLLVLGFFSHISTLAFAVLAIGVIEIVWLVSDLLKDQFDLSSILKRYALILFICAPIGVLSLLFFQNHGGNGFHLDSASFSDQWRIVKSFWPLNIFSMYWEEPITEKLYPTFVALAFVSLLFSLFKLEWRNRFVLKTHGLKVESLLRHSLLVISVLFLIAFVILPPDVSSGGYVKIRLLIAFFLFLIAWFATTRIPLLVVLPFLAVMMFTNHQLFEYREEFGKEHQSMVTELNIASKHIEEGSVVVPIFETHHWFYGHISNYLGTMKPMILLDNYEAVTGYFPLLWKPSPSPFEFLPLPSRNFCSSDIKNLEKEVIPVDVIVHYQEENAKREWACNTEFEELFESEYTMAHVSESGKLKVYRKKNN